jgi:CheY-like chemotaxis protein
MIEEGMPIDQILEFTHVVSKSGRHLLSIIEDILDISLIDSGEAKLAIERFILRDMLDGLYVLASQEKIALNKDQIDVKLVFPDSLIDARLSGDVRKINKIFSHLVKNALKFTKEGSVEIGVKTENVSGKTENVLFYVKDTGIGIPKDKQQIIFEIFRQADDSSTREFEGTGLGLSISKKLIDMMGGSIWVESMPQKGSTFFFELPCLLSVTKALDILHKDDKTQLKTILGHTILVAEDDDTNFHLFKLLLNRKKIEVIRAHNGREAIKAVAEQSRIGLVLMDINMPILNGYDATREIKKLRAELPVIAVTAYAMASDMAKAGEAGCDDYITKPINNVIFYETIMKYLAIDEA